MTERKRKAVYSPEADKRWRETHKEHSRYLSARSAARSFVRNRALEEDLVFLEQLISERRVKLAESQEKL